MTVNRVIVTLFCVMALACGGKLPPGLTPEQQSSIVAARVVNQVGSTAEAFGYVAMALSSTMAALGEAQQIDQATEREIQTALSHVTRNMNRRVEKLLVEIRAGRRPEVRELVVELRYDVDDLLTRITRIPEAAARAELRALAMTLRMALIGLDIAVAS